ncbi:hypothetical protein BaRGS_00006908 [Batillaria attramentaria]|uniref:Uncharacterized protein n=1 Tax=Batillaria attramentaria TaxID=370345 RepID=A0ABD0LS26_9CAEN
MYAPSTLTKQLAPLTSALRVLDRKRILHEGISEQISALVEALVNSRRSVAQEYICARRDAVIEPMLFSRCLPVGEDVRSRGRPRLPDIHPSGPHPRHLSGTVFPPVRDAHPHGDLHLPDIHQFGAHRRRMSRAPVHGARGHTTRKPFR